MISLRLRRQLGLGLIYVGLAFAVFLSLMPIFWVVSTSFKLPRDFYSSPPVLIPTAPTIKHYTSIFVDYKAMDYYKNTFIIAFGNMFLILAVAVPAAYAVARYRVGGGILSFWILSQRMVPPVTLLIPLFLLFATYRLMDTFPGLILSYSALNLPLAIWMLIGFFEDFPQELQDQAMVDGCSEVQAIFRVVLPIIAPGIVVVALFIFVFSWNQLMFPLILSRVNTKPIMLLFVNMLRSPMGLMFGESCACVVLGIIPALILALFFQRYLVKGLSMGAFK
jgi:multiple sugar transport system permease protein